ncbi:LppX_LprAFG lipoprotein [Gordonia lacunae]|uniref:LppX_LprAFG lipoprotein n=1 Tax=Gordonia lacunae TaxID=417102 RepID=UPI0039E43275
MQRAQRVAAAALSTGVVAAIVLTGCSASPTGSPTTTSASASTTVIADPAAQLTAAATNTEALTGAHLDLVVDGTVPNLNAKKLTADLVTTPADAAKGEATVVFGTKDPQEASAPFVYVGGVLYADIAGDGYLSYGDGKSIYDVSVFLDPEDGLANVLRTFQNPTGVGSETIDGVETAQVNGTVPAGALAALTGARQVVGPQDAPVPTTVWLTTGTNQLARLVFTPNPADTTTTITVDLSDWNETVDVEKPDVIQTPTETPSGPPTPGQPTREPAGG